MECPPGGRWSVLSGVVELPDGPRVGAARTGPGKGPTTVWRCGASSGDLSSCTWTRSGKTRATALVADLLGGKAGRSLTCAGYRIAADAAALIPAGRSPPAQFAGMLGAQAFSCNANSAIILSRVLGSPVHRLHSRGTSMHRMISAGCSNRRSPPSQAFTSACCSRRSAGPVRVRQLGHLG
jgi:hypothetical protein